MASQYPTSIGSVSALPLAAALAIIPTLPRPLLNRLVERAIDHMDQQDGDPDIEDATNLEDEGITWAAAIRNDGAGCPVSDPYEDECDRELSEDGPVGEYGIDQRRFRHMHGEWRPEWVD